MMMMVVTFCEGALFGAGLALFTLAMMTRR